jgi:Cu2+-exporting ATPase
MSGVSATRAHHAQWQMERARRAVFGVEGMRCAGCARAIEHAARSVQGVREVTVNLASARVSVDWGDDVPLERILEAIEAAGFRSVPLAGDGGGAERQSERRTALKRIGLAGLGMMQTMMFVYGLYAAEPGAIDAEMAQFLRLVSMLVAAPVLAYSGAPFFIGAWRSLRQRALGMDVPVAGALALAFGASVVNTLRGTGEVYFDSVTMFVFLLLSGRFIELTVRQRSLSASEALARTLPARAARIAADGSVETIPTRSIEAGDRLSIPKGAVIPVDARVDVDSMRVDEALMTGESRPIVRRRGDALLGGSVNVGEAARVTASQSVTGSALASIVALLERAQTERPPLARTADRVASWFVLAVLILASVTAACWLYFDRDRAFEATLAVLVVTCPCALSLATPTALAAATAWLARHGLLVTRPDALERLARATTVVFDKTGTLTSGTRAIERVDTACGLAESRALQIAAALERGSSHPMAAAFASRDDATIRVAESREVAGSGVEGSIDGERYRLGRLDFVLAMSGHARAASVLAPSKADGLYLGRSGGVVARFTLSEDLRPGVRAAVDTLRALGLEPCIASGDEREAVGRIARALRIRAAEHRLSPEAKIAAIHERQRRGERVLMIGDGINDAPVLAAADVSCALGQGAALAQAAADLLVLDESLRAIPAGISCARRALGVMRQNLAWAFAYNLAAVPLAAFGLVAPWVAAIGMSVSSLAVVLNARRLAVAKR